MSKNKEIDVKTAKIVSIIDELRPYLNMDGGDVEFIKYDSENETVYVKMSGACAMCMMQDDTLESGLLYALKEQIPSIEKVINTPL